MTTKLKGSDKKSNILSTLNWENNVEHVAVNSIYLFIPVNIGG